MILKIFVNLTIFIKNAPVQPILDEKFSNFLLIILDLKEVFPPNSIEFGTHGNSCIGQLYQKNYLKSGFKYKFTLFVFNIIPKAYSGFFHVRTHSRR
jgi:hypothetical protein